jgi:serine phosphatase RsbU (regulator of sigma subunit)
MESKNTLMVMGELGPFATTVFVQYDPATGEVVWTSAGHLPPLLVPGDGGEPSFLPTSQQQPPLGVLPGVTYTCEQARLEPGDRLVLYTDGLIERRGESLEEGLQRLRVGVPAGADAATTCRTLLDVLGVASDRPDDVCVVTLRRTA